MVQLKSQLQDKSSLVPGETLLLQHFPHVETKNYIFSHNRTSPEILGCMASLVFYRNCCSNLVVGGGCMGKSIVVACLKTWVFPEHSGFLPHQ